MNYPLIVDAEEMGVLRAPSPNTLALSCATRAEGAVGGEGFRGSVVLRMLSAGYIRHQ